MRRRKKTNPVARWLTWGAVAFLLGWGIRQMVEVRAVIVKDLQQNADDVITPAPNPALAVAVDNAVDAAASPSDATQAASDPLPALPAIQEPAPPVIAPPEALTTDELAQRGRQIDVLIESADQALQSGHLVERRQKLNDALALIAESARATEVRTALAEFNAPVFLGPDVLPDDPYAPLISIEAGDNFLKIAQRYRITSDLLGQLNPQLEARSLRAGGAIKVVYGPFHARLVKHDLRLDLYARDIYVRSFPLHFDEGNFLPAGTYRLSTDGKVRVAGADPTKPLRESIEFRGAQAATQSIDNGCLYGSAGPRSASANGLSGARLDDSDLHQLYNALTESASLIQVDP